MSDRVTITSSFSRKGRPGVFSGCYAEGFDMPTTHQNLESVECIANGLKEARQTIRDWRRRLYRDHEDSVLCRTSLAQWLAVREVYQIALGEAKGRITDMIDAEITKAKTVLSRLRGQGFEDVRSVYIDGLLDDLDYVAEL